MGEIRCIIAGCRDFSDYALLRDTANKIFQNRDTSNLVIVSGCRHLGAFVLLSICPIENRFAGFSNEHEKISAASAAEIFCGCPKRMHIRSEIEQQGSSRGQGPPRMRFCFPFVPGAHMSPGDKRKISAAEAAEIFLRCSNHTFVPATAARRASVRSVSSQRTPSSSRPMWP